MLELSYMPEATKANYLRLMTDKRLGSMVLVGGTALSLQIGHRLSEDLDFNIFQDRLPRKEIDSLLRDIEATGTRVQDLIEQSQKSRFKINSGMDLDHFIQDYLIDGSKVTFHARGTNDRPEAQIAYLRSATKIKVCEGGFSVLGVDGLSVMKTLVTYDRCRSRDIFDLMVLTRDHGLSIEQCFETIAKYQPISNRNFERFKQVVTGLEPLDEKDEGFASLGLEVDMRDVYGHFTELINAYEVSQSVKQLTAMKSRRPIG